MNTTQLLHQRLYQQGLSTFRFQSPAQVVAHYGAIQAQDYAGAKWAIGMRIPGCTDAAVEQAIAERTIVRTWAFRGTLHFVAPSDLRWILDLYTPRFLSSNASFFSKRGIREPVIKKSLDVFAKTLQGGRQATRDELSEALVKHGIPDVKETIGYLLLWASLQGLICFGERRGKEFTHALLDEWIPASTPLSREEALGKLAITYFQSHGPATLQDLAGWSGQLQADLQRAIAIVGKTIRAVQLADQTYYFCEASIPEDVPQAHFLQAYDEYVVGYKDRHLLVDATHKQKVEVANGLSPTVIINGKAMGSWRRTLKKDKVIIELKSFEKLTKQQKEFLESAADRYAKYQELERYELMHA